MMNGSGGRSSLPTYILIFVLGLGLDWIGRDGLHWSELTTMVMIDKQWELGVWDWDWHYIILYLVCGRYYFGASLTPFE